MAVAGACRPSLFVRSPFQAGPACLRGLRQGLLIEQARSQSLPSLTFLTGSVSLRREPREFAW